MMPVPCQRFTIHTQLPVEEALRRLESVVGPNRYSAEPYWGKIEGYHFKIHPVDQRTFLTRSELRRRTTLEGDIQPEATSGCSICITVQSDPNGMKLLWVVLAISSVVAIIEIVLHGSFLDYFARWLIFCFLCALYWGGALGSVEAESLRFKTLFRTLLQAEHVDEALLRIRTALRTERMDEF